MVMANSLTINQHTSARQIEDFLSNDVGQDSRLLARHNSNGDVVLYEKPTPKGLLERLGAFVDRALGRTERREQRALDTVFTSLNRVLDNSNSEQKNLLTQRIQQTVNLRQEQGGLTAKFLGGVLFAARNLPPATERSRAAAGIPSLASLGISSDDPAILAAARTLSAEPGKTDEVVGALTALVLNKFLAGNPDAGEREAFALSDGLTLVSQLESALKAALDKIDPGKAGERLPSFGQLSTAFLANAGKVLPDGVVDNTAREIRWGDKETERAQLSNVKIGGVEYAPVRFLGEGGFANVYEFRSVDNPDLRIALKVTRGLEEMQNNDDYAKTVKGAGEEINLHRGAYGDGSKEVVGYVGRLRLPDGNVAVAMELAPNGDVHSMGRVLSEAVKSGQISEGEANTLRLTLLKDMARGLDHMHRTQGMTHYDFKSPNCFIGSDGTAKVGDFGLTMRMEETAGLDRAGGKVDNPIFKAPELLRSEEVSARIDEFTRETVDNVTRPAMERLRDIFPGGPKKDVLLNALSRNVFAEPIRDIESGAGSDKSMLFFDRKVDIWGLGSSALEMFTGKGIGEQRRWMNEITDDVTSFGSNRNNRPLSDPDEKGNPKPGSLGLRTGNEQIDDLLTRMLMPDPRDRASASELLSHPALRAQGGVDSREARALIVALSSGDPEKIATARRALSALTSPTVVSNASPSGEDLVLSVDEVFELLGREPGGRV